MSDLCIVGDGYLYQLLNIGNQFIARICRIQPLINSMRHESLWINCYRFKMNLVHSDFPVFFPRLTGNFYCYNKKNLGLMF